MWVSYNLSPLFFKVGRYELEKISCAAVTLAYNGPSLELVVMHLQHC